MEKFTEIGLYRNLINEVRSNWDYRGKDEYDKPIYIHETPYPTIRFRGTVKLHGTNASICATKIDNLIEYTFHSRTDTLSIHEDNAGFMNAMMLKDYQSLFSNVQFNERCVIYGEWAGKGIQKNMAINKLDKFFAIFAIRIDGKYIPLENYQFIKNENQRIFNILDFNKYSIEIDFNKPEIAQPKLDELISEVEKECPVGKHFGVIGIGEGIVWEAYSDVLNRRYMFKSKGEKHVHKPKNREFNLVEDERTNKCIEIANKVTPSWRLEQMINLSCNILNGGYIDRKNMSTFIKMVIDDVVKEDIDIIIDAGFEIKDINKYISKIAKDYFFEQEKF